MPSLFRPGRMLTLAALLCLLAPGVLSAQEKHPIGMNATVGQTWDFNHSLNSDMTIKQSFQGQVQDVVNAMTQTRVGTITVREVTRGVPTAITIVFGKECGNSIKANGQEQAPPFPLAGQTVNLKRGPDGVSHDLKMNLDPMTQNELEQMMEFDTSMYPQMPVGVGDEWTPNAAKLKEQLQLAPEDKLDVKCKLLKVGSIRNVRTYDISLTGSVDKNQQGMNMTVKLGGVLQLDAGSGLPVQSDVVVQIGLNGNQQAPGPDGQPIAVTINGGGKIQIASAVTPKQGFGGGGVGGDVVVEGPGPIPGLPPVNPGPKPRNPLAGAEASPFAGSFKGRQLSAEFDVNGDKVTGSIKLGNRTFPATGSIADGKLTGAFDADGAKFQFVAALEGQTMTLDSEGNKYTLQKEAAAAPPAPRNPLE